MWCQKWQASSFPHHGSFYPQLIWRWSSRLPSSFAVRDLSCWLSGAFARLSVSCLSSLVACSTLRPARHHHPHPGHLHSLRLVQQHPPSVHFIWIKGLWSTRAVVPAHARGSLVWHININEPCSPKSKRPPTTPTFERQWCSFEVSIVLLNWLIAEGGFHHLVLKKLIGVLYNCWKATQIKGPRSDHKGTCSHQGTNTRSQFLPERQESKSENVV